MYFKRIFTNKLAESKKRWMHYISVFVNRQSFINLHHTDKKLAIGYYLFRNRVVGNQRCK